MPSGLCRAGPRWCLIRLPPIAKGAIPAPSTCPRSSDRPEAGAGNVTLTPDRLRGVTISIQEAGKRVERRIAGRCTATDAVEILIRKDIREIPPLFPILCSRRDRSRLRMAMAAQGRLVINHEWANDGNILFLAGGGSGRTQYCFETAERTSSTDARAGRYGRFRHPLARGTFASETRTNNRSNDVQDQGGEPRSRARWR
jgi:hypothetical protein